MMTEGWIDTMKRPFGIEVGVVPTEDANVIETHRLMQRLHKHVCCLVDGDAAGLDYADQLRQGAAPPCAIIRWNDGAMIEDAIGWILNADEPTVVGKLAEIPPQPPASTKAVVAYLKRLGSSEEVEELTVIEEDVEFLLPKELVTIESASRTAASAN